MNELVRELYRILQDPEHKEFFDFVRYDSVEKDVNEDKVVILRDDTNDIVGFSTLHIYQTTSPLYKVKKNDVRIKQIVVKPKHKGKGYGKEMVEMCKHHVRKLGGDYLCLSVEAHNVKACGFYDKMGFTVVNNGVWKKKNSGDIKYLVYRIKCN